MIAAVYDTTDRTFQETHGMDGIHGLDHGLEHHELGHGHLVGQGHALRSMLAASAGEPLAMPRASHNNKTPPLCSQSRFSQRAPQAHHQAELPHSTDHEQGAFDHMHIGTQNLAFFAQINVIMVSLSIAAQITPSCLISS